MGNLTTRKQLGENLKTLRIDAELTRKQVAELAGTHQNIVSRIEHGVTLIKIDLVKKIFVSIVDYKKHQEEAMNEIMAICDEVKDAAKKVTKNVENSKKSA